VEFTRCRPYRKNDQAHIEQKNWVAVRQLIGYDRYEGEREAELMEEVYRDWRLLVNFFQPVRKLVGKERARGRVREDIRRGEDAVPPGVGTSGGPGGGEGGIA
jgi:hypothetical protein